MIEAMKQWLEAFEIAAEGGGVNFHAYAKELRQAIAEFDSHTLYREGYVNGYAFGEAAGKQAIAELESQEPVALEALVMICVKCRSNEWGPDTPRKQILNWFHDTASKALEDAQIFRGQA